MSSFFSGFLSEDAFSGKRVLVTGGTGGIGGVISQSLAGLGARLFLNYRDKDRRAHQVLGEIHSSGGSAELVKADLMIKAEVSEMFEQIAESGRLDCLIHCAALGTFKPTLEVRANQWDLTLNINTRSLLLCAQHAVSLMEQRGGKIVSLSSLGSSRVVPSYGAIGVSKAALEALTRYLAVELAPHRIQVNAVAAGLVDTASIRQHPFYARLAEETLRQTPAGRLATAEDVAGAVLFLISPLADWISGQILIADGGLSLGMIAPDNTS